MAKPGTTRVEQHVRSVFPDGAISRVRVLEYGDDPAVEPGDVAVRVFIEQAGENPNLPAWHRGHETMIGDLQHELAQQLPGASHLEFWFGENGPPRPERAPAR